MANQEQVSILKQGGSAWNKWRNDHPFIRPDLSGAELTSADLSDYDLSKADLREATLTYASLPRARLWETNLHKAELQKANLEYALIWKADLTRVKLNEANLIGAQVSETDLTGAELDGADLRKSHFVEVTLDRASLNDCRVYGISAWNVSLADACQFNLLITRPPEYQMRGVRGGLKFIEPKITVDDLEVAQFIYLLLNHKKLRNVLNAITERGVLILGRFGGGGIEVLEAIAAKLRESKYLPFTFDFDRPTDRNYTETVKTLVGLSRFVIVDLSGPSVPQELYATVPHFKIPFVPIIEEGRREYSMVVDILEYPWVLNPPVRFVDVEHLVRAMPAQIIVPAEKRVKDRPDRLADLFDV